MKTFEECLKEIGFSYCKEGFFYKNGKKIFDYQQAKIDQLEKVITHSKTIIENLMEGSAQLEKELKEQADEYEGMLKFNMEIIEKQKVELILTKALLESEMIINKQRETELKEMGEFASEHIEQWECDGCSNSSCDGCEVKKFLEKHKTEERVNG